LSKDLKNFVTYVYYTPIKFFLQILLLFDRVKNIGANKFNQIFN